MSREERVSTEVRGFLETTASEALIPAPTTAAPDMSPSPANANAAVAEQAEEKPIINGAMSTTFSTEYTSPGAAAGEQRSNGGQLMKRENNWPNDERSKKTKKKKMSHNTFGLAKKYTVSAATAAKLQCNSSCARQDMTDCSDASCPVAPRERVVEDIHSERQPILGACPNTAATRCWAQRQRLR